MAQNWIDIPIFISSTFNDMHGERDYLVKNVFPELAEWCEAHQMRLIDIDLRWGVTSADSEANNTVRKCLQSIDDCRPFFLCFLGQRRGWVPQPHEISPETYAQYPTTKDLAGERSVTEMEIEHALLSPMLKIVDGVGKQPIPNKHVLFFFREDPFDEALDEAHRRLFKNDAVADMGESPAEASTKLAAYKDTIRHQWQVTDYVCDWSLEAYTPELAAEPEGATLSKGRLVNFHVPESNVLPQIKNKIEEEFPQLSNAKEIPLKYVLLAQLMLEIEAAYPQQTASSAEAERNKYSADLKQQEIFAKEAAAGFIPVPYALAWLNAYLKSDEPQPFVLTAAAGLGKTTLLAHWTNAIAWRDKKIYARFCGASDLASDSYSLWESIFHQGNITVPTTLEELQKRFPQLLAELAQQGEAVIVIDGINQLPQGLEMLSWLTQNPLPQGIKLILSVKEDETTADVIQRYSESKLMIMGKLTPLSEKSQKEALINEYLKRSLKALDDDYLNGICSAKESGNPLFLKILLSELRVFGSFKQLREAIESYGDSPFAAFTQLLRRLEAEQAYNIIASEVSVPLLFGLLSVARNGLSENELTACFAERFPDENQERIQGTIRYFLRQTRAFLARREGRVDFLYESFKLAAQAAYSSLEKELQAVLADCFLACCDPDEDASFNSSDRRALTEYAYHLVQSDAVAGQALYQNVPYLDSRCSFTSMSGLLSEFDKRCSGELSAKLREQIFRYRQFLADYPHGLPSMLYACDDAILRSAVLEAQRAQKIKNLWLKADVVRKFLSTEKQADGDLALQVISEADIGFVAAAVLAKTADLAFLAVGKGQIKVINTRTLEPFSALISVRGKQILNLAVSDNGEFLVAGFEDETAEIFQLEVVEKHLLVHPLGTIRYLLPYDGPGLFAFEDDQALWFQDEANCLVRWSLAGKKVTGSIEVPDEVTSLAVSGERLYCTIWQRSCCTLAVYSLQTQELAASKDFAEDDIVFLRCEEDLVFAASSRSKADAYEVYRLNENLEILTSVSLSAPAAAVCQVGSRLLIMPRYKPDQPLYLWDYNSDSPPKKALESRFQFSTQAYLAVSSDSLLTFLGNDRVLRFEVSVGHTAEKETILDLAYQEGDVAVFSKDKAGNILYRKADEVAQLPKDQYLTLLSQEKSILLSHSGKGWRKKSADFVPFDVEGWPVAAAMSGELLYYFDNNMILRGANGFVENLQSYQLSLVKLYTDGDLLVLTAVAGMQAAVIDRKPFIVMFYRIQATGALKKIGERRFSIVQEPIEFACCNVSDGWVYLFFKKPAEAEIKERSGSPWVVYGTPEAIINNIASAGYLKCSMENLTAAAFGKNLLVCSDGVVTCCDSRRLTYQGAIAAPAEIRQLRRGLDGVQLLVIDTHIAAKIQIKKGGSQGERLLE